MQLQEEKHENKSSDVMSSHDLKKKQKLSLSKCFVSVVARLFFLVSIFQVVSSLSPINITHILSELKRDRYPDRERNRKLTV